MKLSQMFQDFRYTFLTLFLTLTMLVLYPVFQVLPQGGLYNFWFLFTILTPVRWALYIIYSLFFGLTLTFFIWRFRTKTCYPSEQVRSGLSGFAGAVLGFIIPSCPACLSLASLLLPLSAFSALAANSTGIMAGSVVLLLGSLWYLGAFRG